MELSDIEAVLAEVVAEIGAVRPDECLACYLDRTLPQLGCDAHTLTDRWNAAQPRPVARLTQWVRSQGGFCDCEVVFNAFGRGRRSETHQLLQCDGAFATYENEIRAME